MLQRYRSYEEGTRNWRAYLLNRLHATICAVGMAAVSLIASVLITSIFTFRGLL